MFEKNNFFMSACKHTNNNVFTVKTVLTKKLQPEIYDFSGSYDCLLSNVGIQRNEKQIIENEKN